MLTPEKSANLIFIGKYNSTIFNDTLCNVGKIKKKFYKLDIIIIRENILRMKISLNCVEKIDNYKNNNNLTIEIFYLNYTKIINKILINNNIISKEINNNNLIYNDYQFNDFPFWLCLYDKNNKEKNKINITSDYLINFFN